MGSKEQEADRLLGEFEKLKGYSGALFDNEEWAEYDAFVDGYRFAKSELQPLS